MDVSVVVPLYNEEESLPELVAWIRKVCKEHALEYEVILVDDGSTDRSWQVVEQLASKMHGSVVLNFAATMENQQPFTKALSWQPATW